ncbi:MAG: nuclear transport factor 2 family protein [Pseudomonadales bacterium]
MMRIVLLMLILLSPFISADEGKKINSLLDGFHLAATNSEFDNYFSRFAEQGIFLGTDAAERWNVQAFKAYAKQAFADGNGWHYEVVSRNIKINEGLAWFDEVLDNSRLGRCRGTGILLKEGGEWKIAQYSLTLLIPNEIAMEVGKQTMAIDGPNPE